MEKDVINYPCVMMGFNEMIVLFNKDNCGMVIREEPRSNDKSYKLGYYSTTWKMMDFIEYTAEVIVKNK